MRSKPFTHPAIITVLRDTIFAPIRGGSIAARNDTRFKSSLSARPTELEIPDVMLALIATAVRQSFLVWAQLIS